MFCFHQATCTHNHSLVCEYLNTLEAGEDREHEVEAGT